MRMRETVKSMRAYFILSGLYGLLMSVGLLVRSHGKPLVLVIGATGFIVGGLFLVMGVLLPKLVSSNSQLVPRVLLGTAVCLGLYLLVGLWFGVGIGDVVQALLGLLLTWYLFRNYKRLARDASVQPAA